MQLMTETKDSRFCELQGFRNHYFYWRMHGNSSTGKLWAGRSESSSDRSDFLSAAAGWRVAGAGAVDLINRNGLRVCLMR